MKKSIIFLVLLMKLVSAMDIKEFAEKYHEEFATREEEEKAAKVLAKSDAQIELQNALYAAGLANFNEEMNELGDVDNDEFVREKTGDIGKGPWSEEPGEPRFYFGLIHDEGENTVEEISQLDKIYDKIDRRFLEGNNSLPSSYDSRAKGYITSVKNQGNCGSCVAFGTTAALEASLIKAGASKSELDISEQHLLDCGYQKHTAKGCSGAAGHSYAKFYENEGDKKMYHEITYPYVENQNNYQCQIQTYWNPGAQIEDVHWDYECNDEKMMKLIYEFGAISTGLWASDSGFKFYKSGVFDTCSMNISTNHAVAIVGWGTENGVDYWLIKNSWGKYWGDNGYIKVKRGTCGIRSCVFFECSASGNPDPIPPPGDGHCDDANPTCSKYESDCHSDHEVIKEYMKKNCKKTCNFCEPKQIPCDVSKTFGKLEGDHILKLNADGKEYRPEVTCIYGLCKAKNIEILDSCQYICGSSTCDNIKISGDCKDMHTVQCTKWAETGKCYHSFVKKHCQKACGLCGDGPKPDCKDKKEKCEEYANAGYCNHSSMKKYCPKSCDLC